MGLFFFFFGFPENGEKRDSIFRPKISSLVKLAGVLVV